jgi:hypothetical protein
VILSATRTTLSPLIAVSSDECVWSVSDIKG